MVVTIPDLLDATQLEALCSVLRQGNFVDGRLSAGSDAEARKRNLELDSGGDADRERYDALNSVVMSSLVRHPDYLLHAMPARIGAPIYARYLDGMEYGGHIDDPLMGAPGARFRSDISISIFLNAPREYDGGELTIGSGAEQQSWKLDAGCALLYPSDSYHAVQPVTRGERLVAVTWVQSNVRHAAQRRLLVQLAQARDLARDIPGSACYEKINLAYANLFRMWAEP